MTSSAFHSTINTHPAAIVDEDISTCSADFLDAEPLTLSGNDFLDGFEFTLEGDSEDEDDDVTSNEEHLSSSSDGSSSSNGGLSSSSSDGHQQVRDSLRDSFNLEDYIMASSVLHASSLKASSNQAAVAAVTSSMDFQFESMKSSLNCMHIDGLLGSSTGNLASNAADAAQQATPRRGQRERSSSPRQSRSRKQSRHSRAGRRRVVSDVNFDPPAASQQEQDSGMELTYETSLSNLAQAMKRTEASRARAAMAREALFAPEQRRALEMAREALGRENRMYALRQAQQQAQQVQAPQAQQQSSGSSSMMGGLFSGAVARSSQRLGFYMGTL